MTTYFVSPTGSDGAAGTATGTAWQTLAKVNGFSFTNGDTIQFQAGGTFRGTTDPLIQVSASSLTFTSYDTGANPVLSGGTVVTGFSVFSGNTYSASLATLVGVPPIVTYNNGTTTTVLTAGSAAGTLTANQYFFSAATLYVNLGGTNPSAGTIEVAAHLIMDCFNRPGVTLRNLTFSHSANTSVIIGDAATAGHLVDSCTFQYSTQLSGGRAGVCLIRSTGPGGSRVTNCTFNYLSNDGIYIQNAPSVEVDHCTMINMGTLVGDQQTDGIQVENSTAPNQNSNGFSIHDNSIMMGSVTPKGCIVIGADQTLGTNSATGTVERNILSGGIFGVAPGATGVVVRNNVISGQSATNSYGIFIQQLSTNLYTGIVLAYNLIYGSDLGIGLQLGTNKVQVTIAQNTIVDCPRSHIQIMCPVYGTIENNILWSTIGNPLVYNVYVDSVAGGQTLLMDYNAFPTANANLFHFGTPGATYATLAAWTGATTFDSHSISSTDPKFVTGNSNYLLSPASPAINAGTVIGGINQIIYGSAPDLGYAEKNRGGLINMGVGA